jgi:hypothetical protein
MVGKKISSGNKTAVIQTVPYYFYAADDSGMCYSDSKNKTILNENEVLFIFIYN